MQTSPNTWSTNKLLPAAEVALNGFCRRMAGLGYEVYSWGESVQAPLDMNRLAGRFYLRARRGNQVFDATYECEYLPFDRAWRRREVVGGVPCARLEDIAKLMRVRNSAKDRRQLARIRRL